MWRGQTRSAPNLKRGSENIYLFCNSFDYIVDISVRHLSDLPVEHSDVNFTCLIVFVHHLQPALFKQVPVVCTIAHTRLIMMSGPVFSEREDGKCDYRL